MKLYQKLLFALGLVAFLIGSETQVQAQQDPQYSQYMFNPLAYNPAYAGSRDALSANVLLRRQWMGIADGPSTGTISIHTPSPNERHGFGLNYIFDQLGVTTQNFLNLAYAYRLPLGPGFLSLGLQGGLTSYRLNYAQINPRDPDPSKPDVALSALLPRAGTGIYFQSERFFAGLSVPNLIGGRYFRGNSNVTDDVAAAQEIHYFATIGGILPLGSSVQFRPSAIVKYVADSPLQVDLNTTFFFKETIGVGVGYRTADALIFMLEYRSKRLFRAGYAYDLSLSPIRAVNSGSHELMLGVDLNWGRSKFLSPRYF
ncbi:MAG: type IX secretion system membrane protein PorP/SprF [Bacteroidota bacterium]